MRMVSCQNPMLYTQGNTLPMGPAVVQDLRRMVAKKTWSTKVGISACNSDEYTRIGFVLHGNGVSKLLLS